MKKAKSHRTVRGAALFFAVLALLLAAGAAGAAQFSHQSHEQIEKDLTCRACHKRDALGIVPEKDVCSTCHTADYLGEVEPGKVKTHGSFWYREHKEYATMSGGGDRAARCIECHDEAFCHDCHNGGEIEKTRQVRIHTSDYRVTHPVQARFDQRSCSSCHEASFCIDCHDRFNRNDLRLESHRRGWSDLSVGASPVRHETFSEDQCQSCHPNGMLPKHEWSSRHGREARRDLMLCKSCHDGADVCIKCHSARRGLGINPHPRGWDNIKDKYRRASDGEVCSKCH